MTTTKSNFARLLYAYIGGKPKPEHAKVTRAATSYDDVTGSTFSSDFGSGTSTKQNGQLTTTSKLGDFLQPSAQTAGQGLNSNLAYLNKSPSEQASNALAGNDPYYNVLKEQLDRNTRASLGRLAVDSQGTGTANSTTAGAGQAGILNNAILNSNTNLMNALNFGNQTATNNVGTNLNAIGSLANLTVPLGTAANQNLLSAFNNKDASTATYTQGLNNEALRYAQAMDQYNLDRYNNGWIGTMSKMSPAFGFAAGRPDQAYQGLQNNAQMIGAAMGMGGGMGGMSSGSASTPSLSSYSGWNPYYSNYFSNQATQSPLLRGYSGALY